MKNGTMTIVIKVPGEPTYVGEVSYRCGEAAAFWDVEDLDTNLFNLKKAIVKQLKASRDGDDRTLEVKFEFALDNND